MEFRLVKVHFSYESYIDQKYLREGGRDELQERMEEKLRELLPQIDPGYTTGKHALKVDKLFLMK